MTRRGRQSAFASNRVLLAAAGFAAFVWCALAASILQAERVSVAAADAADVAADVAAGGEQPTGAAGALNMTGAPDAAAGRQVREISPPRPVDLTPELEPHLLRLLAALNLDYPGLEAVRAAYLSGDLALAAGELLQYYRLREWSPRLFGLMDRRWNWQLSANNLLHNIFTLQGVSAQQPLREGGGLDWLHRGPRTDAEWAWMLNRHDFLLDLFEAWSATGDSRYLKKIDFFICDWVLANPYPARRTFSAPWRPLEVARRVGSPWLRLFASLQGEPEFSEQARILMLSSLPDHADALMNYSAHWGNHLLTEKVTLVLLAEAWPEFKDTQRWLDSALATLGQLQRSQVYADGSYKELSSLYQSIALEGYQRLVALLSLDKDTRRLSALLPTVERMWRYYAFTLRPDGQGPLNNDADLRDNRWQLDAALNSDLFGESGELGKAGELRFIASGGERGREPALPATRFFPFAGHAVMRSDWSERAQWALFDIGPEGTDHRHNDRLHLSLMAGGKDFLVDSGRYTYRPGRWRDYFSGPSAHNVILLDGQGAQPAPVQVAEPLPVLAQIGQGAARFAASVRYARPSPWAAQAEHTRLVEYVYWVGWIVVDEVFAATPATMEVLWNFHPERIVKIVAPAHAVDSAVVSAPLPASDAVFAVAALTQGASAAPVGSAVQTFDAHGVNLRFELHEARAGSVGGAGGKNDESGDAGKRRAPDAADARASWELLRGQEHPRIGGWYSDTYNARVASTQAVYKRQVRPGAVRLVWLIAEPEQMEALRAYAKRQHYGAPLKDFVRHERLRLARETAQTQSPGSAD